VLLTSANLSKAAWGELQKDGTQFMIRNFEIGVLFLPSLAEQQEKEWISAETNGNTQTTHQNEPKKTKVQYQAGSVPSLISIGEDSKIITFPLPYVIPPKKYELNDRPWIWDVQYKEPDILGNFWYL
jgi:tyrosyl-DNA phosphodiesterase-1